MLRALALMLLATPALAEMRPQEADRLAAFDATFGSAMRQAMEGGSRGDVDLLQEALAGAPLPPLQTTLAGDWRCRTLKLGGNLPLVAYAPFDCRITPEGTTFTLEKLTGSQLTRGRITLIEDRMIYLGVGYVADVEPLDYGDLPEGTFGDGERQPQVGIVEQPGPDTIRILFPDPIVESDFDILYLTR